MKLNLISSYYESPNSTRKYELDFCKEKNLLSGFEKLVFWGKDELPTYNDLFSLCDSFIDDINIVANADIYFLPESLERIKIFFDRFDGDKSKLCLALTRWEFRDDGNHRFMSDKGSQDVWCFFGKINFTENTNFKIGTPGCDNRLVDVLRNSLNYLVLNPSLFIKTIHYHPSGNATRTYLENGKRTRKIDGPYDTVDICNFEN